MTRAEEMLRMYADGSTLAEVGEAYGVSRARVAQIIGPQGEFAHNGSRKKYERQDRLKEAFSRIAKGTTTLAEEAALEGIKPASLRDALTRLGLELPKKGEIHGYYRYTRGCRCDACVAGMRAYVNGRRARKAPRHVHGTYNGYVNYACRCKRCRAANAKQTKQQRIARRRRKEVAE